MSIEVSGGGAFAVTTESLLNAERMLDAAAARAHGAAAEAGDCAALLATVDTPAAWALSLAQHELGEIARDAQRLAEELRFASEAYGWAERAAAARQGLLARAAGPAATIGLAITALAVASVRKRALATDDQRFLEALRDVADSLDLGLVVAGAQAIPGPALEETPVAALRVGATSASASSPSGFAALAERIPEPAMDAPKVRVERYALPDGAVHWIVYVAGTADWALTPGSDPWDDTSNAMGLVGRSAGSTRATMAALVGAGWQPGEPVLPVGHSQGGMVATALAAGGIAPVPMLVTFGSPVADASVPRGALAVAVEHRNDLVPAVGGHAPFSDTRLMVRDTAPRVPGGGAAATHSMAGYAETARQLDGSSDERVIGARAALADFTGGQQAEVTMWRGERLTARRGG